MFLSAPEKASGILICWHDNRLVTKPWNITRLNGRRGEYPFTLHCGCMLDYIRAKCGNNFSLLYIVSEDTEGAINRRQFVDMSKLTIFNHKHPIALSFVSNGPTENITPLVPIMACQRTGQVFSWASVSPIYRGTCALFGLNELWYKHVCMYLYMFVNVRLCGHVYVFAYTCLFVR